MALPLFTADASLYRSARTYRTSTSGNHSSPANVAAAYEPEIEIGGIQECCFPDCYLGLGLRVFVDGKEHGYICAQV